jgi:tripartite-type tricarboxylate transporter receptor subunit TctC
MKFRQAKLFQAGALIGALCSGAFSAAQAQDAYPSKPIHVISSQAVGGGVDALLRAIGVALGERTGQGFVVDAKPGANGLLATNACASAKPDGYTICLVNTQFVLLPSLQTKPSYDPLKSFDPVTHIVTASLALAVQKAVPATNLAQLVAYSKANPGKLNYIALGPANPVDLGLQALMRQHDISWTAIPYKGANDGMQAFAAGDVQIMFFTSLNVIAATSTGGGTMLFVTGDKRLPKHPQVPTLAETGFPNPDVSGIWFGLIAPPGTPKAIRDKLASEIAEVLKSPAIVKRASETGYDLIGNSPDQFGAFLAAERARSATALKNAPKID